MLTEWKYTVDPTADDIIMFIENHIGFDEESGQGVSGSDFKRELFELDKMNKKSILVCINSPGGIVTEGMEIYYAILAVKTKVDTMCYGIAASISGVIFQAGRTRIMTDYATLMYHKAFDTADPERKEADPARDALNDAIVTMVSSRTGLSKDEINKIMDKETFFSPDEALKMKFCDEIQASNEQNKKRATTKDVKALWKDYSKILNKYKNTLTAPDMKKICNVLGLNPEASEDSIVMEITRIIDRKKADMDDLEKKMDAIKQELEGKKGDCTNLQNKYDDMKKEYDDMKKKGDDEEMDKKKNRAKATIADAVKLNKIVNKADIIEEWETNFVKDEDATTKLLKTLGVNVKSADFRNIENNLDLSGATDEEKEAVAWEARTGQKYGSAAWIAYKNLQKVNSLQAKSKL